MVRNTSILAEQLSTDAPVFVEAEHLAPEIVTAWPQFPMSARIIAYLYAVTFWRASARRGKIGVFRTKRSLGQLP